MINNIFTIPISILVAEWGSSGWLKNSQSLSILAERNYYVLEICLPRLLGLLLISIGLLVSLNYFSDPIIRSQISFFFALLPGLLIWSLSSFDLYDVKQRSRFDPVLRMLPSLLSWSAGLFCIWRGLIPLNSSALIALVFSVGCLISVFLSFAMHRQISYALKFPDPRFILHLFASGLLVFLATSLPLIASRIISGYLFLEQPNQSLLYNLLKSISSSFNRIVALIRSSFYSSLVSPANDSASSDYSFSFFFSRHLSLTPLFISSYLIFSLVFWAVKITFGDGLNFYLYAVLSFALLNWFLVTIKLMEWNFKSMFTTRLIYVLLSSCFLYVFVRSLSLDNIAFVLIAESFSMIVSIIIASSLSKVSMLAPH